MPVEIAPAIIPPKEEITSRDQYNLPDGHFVSEWVNTEIYKVKNNRLITPDEIEKSKNSLNINELMDSLKRKNISENDFVGILKLAMLTECATDTYAEVFRNAAKKFDQPWLGTFIDDFWTPDEHSHYLPYRNMLLQVGVSETEVDNEVKAARGAPFEHGKGADPIYATTFGIVQEDLTDNYHGLIADVVSESSPDSARLIRRVKQRESLHMSMYISMTSLQLEQNPRLVTNVAKALSEFKLPGNEVAPAYQGEAVRWLELMGSDTDKLVQRIFRHIHQIADDPRTTGKIAMEVAARKKLPQIPFVSKDHIVKGLNKLGHPGAGIIGEATLLSMGMKNKFNDESEGLAGAARRYFRELAAGQIKGFAV